MKHGTSITTFCGITFNFPKINEAAAHQSSFVAGELSEVYERGSAETATTLSVEPKNFMFEELATSLKFFVARRFWVVWREACKRVGFTERAKTTKLFPL